MVFDEKIMKKMVRLLEIAESIDKKSFKRPFLKMEDSLITLLTNPAYKRSLAMLLKGFVLMRGFSTGFILSPWYILKRYTSPRKPMDVPMEVDKFVEEFRKRSFPKVPSRQYAVFCLAVDIRKRRDYKPGAYGGQKYIILPDNSAKVFQNPEVIDFFDSEYDLSIRNFNYSAQHLENGLALSRLTVERGLTQYFSKGKHRIEDLEYNSGTGNFAEVIVEPQQSYLAISYDVLSLNAYDRGKDLLNYLWYLTRKL